MTTVLSRGHQVRRGGRGPGWGLLTALLVLAIAASSALVFTSRVELLKLAVILALWAAFVAAFVSVIYRRQSDVDRARARDLKLVYDLQLDREISARREYELTVESQLRRELASELRAQAADEVAALREELATLRTNLQILFDTDLEHHPALETERTTVRAYSDWDRHDGARYDGESMSGAGVSHASAAHPHDNGDRTEENPIIDVPEVGVPVGGGPSGPPRQPAAEARSRHAEAYRGTHRRGSDHDAGWAPPANGRPSPQGRPQRQPAQHSRRQPEPPVPHPEPWPPAAEPVAAETAWPGAPGGYSRHSGPPEPAADSPAAAESPGPHGESRQGAHGRHSAEPPGHRREMASATSPAPEGPAPSTARHRSADPETDTGTAGPGPQTGGQSVSELLARLRTAPTGRRRHRRED
jgi:hypothetical protein